MITCPVCATELNEDGSEANDDQFCDNCGDFRPFEDGICQRCHGEPINEPDQSLMSED